MTDHYITQKQLDSLERAADKVFTKLGIDIEFTRHFLDRVNDDRNGNPITIRELGQILAKEYKKWGRRISAMDIDAEAVMKDLSSELNIPFVLNKSGKGKALVAKTVMRKKQFHSPDPILTVEDNSTAKNIAENYQLMLQKGAWECAQMRANLKEGRMVDPREAILRKALTYLDEMVNSNGDMQSIGGYAFDIVRSFDLKGIVTARELAQLYNDWKPANEELAEVAGPDDCWDGYKKDGTQAGSGKNKGKRVNNCVKDDS
jgi:hypothetical protein